MRAMTRERWASLKEVLLHVPIKARNVAWKEAMNLVEDILSNRNNLAPELDERSGCFAVECALCRQQIGVDEDFVRHAITGTYVHYDCHHRSTGPIGA